MQPTNNELPLIMNQLFCVIAFIGFFIGCNESDDINIECINNLNSPRQSDQEYFDYYSASSKWVCSGINSYSMSYVSITQDCPDTEIFVEVEVGEIRNVDVSVGQFSNPFNCDTDNNSSIYSIEELFNLIEEAVDESIEIDFTDLGEGIINRADGIIVEYDEFFGYPRSIRLDYIRSISDEELAIEISNFELSN